MEDLPVARHRTTTSKTGWFHVLPSEPGSGQSGQCLESGLDSEWGYYHVANGNNAQGAVQGDPVAVWSGSCGGYFSVIYERTVKWFRKGHSFRDDILIDGRTVAEYKGPLRKALQLIQDDGLCLNATKCAF